MDLYKIVRLCVDHGMPEVMGVEARFTDRDEAIAAWDEPGRFIQTPEPGALYYYQHLLVVERDGRHFTLDGEPMWGIPDLP